MTAAALVTLCILCALILSACNRDRTYPRFSDVQVPESSGSVRIGERETSLPPQHLRAMEKQELNSNAVGWLYIPDTDIDDVVMFHPTDNTHYVRRDFEENYSFDGILFADRRSRFGTGLRNELARNTVLYGNSNPEDEHSGMKFTRLRRYLDPEFMRNHPYIFFSTTAEDMAWEVFAVCYAHVDLPYNRTDLSDAEINRVLEKIMEASLYEWDSILEDGEKILTLTTNVDTAFGGDWHEYRLVVMARLVPPGQAVQELSALRPKSYEVLPAMKE